ncbi:thioredoxin family protein [Maribacter sp.]|uniref:thioredoxin family protein n=1 Tax=Maribacter sp. TaxID=1897614 RepID=UPI0025B93FEE|nr:thioredoxin family protein [Maribacter sp.]
MEVKDNTVEKTTRALIQESYNKAVSYEDYRSLLASLSAEGKATGPNESEELTEYTILNDKRMKRLDKTVKVSEENTNKIKSLGKKVTWLVLTESWCGDAAQIMPVMNKMAELTGNINFKVLQRDQNLELMSRFLTNGTLSIPKLIMVDSETNEVISEWGSRPSVATKMVENFKKEHGGLTPEFKQDLQVWYNKDKGQSTISDLVKLLNL